MTSPPQLVTTRQPVFTDATCAHPGATRMNLPGQTVATSAGALATSVLNGVTYTATGTAKPGGTVVVKAKPGATQVLTAGSTTRWTHTFAKPTNCSTTSAPSGHHAHHAHHGTEGEHVVHHPTQVTNQGGQQPAAAVVPSFVDSGLVSTVTGSGQAPGWLTQLRERALLLVLSGGLLLLGGGSWLGLGRRRRGALV